MTPRQKSNSAGRLLVFSAALIATLAAVLVWRSGRGPASVPTSVTGPMPSRQEMPAPSVEGIRLRSAQERAKRDALHAEISRVLASLPPSSANIDPKAALNPTRPPKVYPPGDLRDRIGGRDALSQSLNRDFMPLAQECIERAQEQSPALKGMLALSLETISDEQLGAVVDVAEAAPNNEVVNPGLLECIRETAYSLRLPRPTTTGREKFMLTLPIDPVADLGPTR